MMARITLSTLAEGISRSTSSDLLCRPARYGDVELLRFLIRYRANSEGDTQHTLTHSKLLLSKTSAIEAALSTSPNRRNGKLPSEILEQIISHLSPEDFDMPVAKSSITFFLATLAATRNHVRCAIAETEDLMCVLNGKTVILSERDGAYPPGTEIRWAPIKAIEKQRFKTIGWANALCRVVGFKL
jgi:hypothetical protein